MTVDSLRDVQPMTVKTTLGMRAGEAGKVQDGMLRGITVQDLTRKIRAQLGLYANLTGVVINEIDPNSPAHNKAYSQVM